MLNRIFKACMVAIGLCLGTGQVSAQTFSPDGKQILFPHYTPQGSPVQAIVNTDGTGLMEIPESSGSVVAKWSPNGKYILFGNAQREVKLYQIKLGKTRTIAQNVEPPFAWREDSVTFAAVRVSRDQTTQRETRELCRFDRDGYLLGQTHLGDIRLAPFTPLYWIPNTDEQIFMTNEQTNVNAYLTDSHELRKVSSSNDLIGMGSIGNSQHVVWARRGRNFRYILMTLYRFNATLTSVSRPEFPERIPALNPDPHHAPDSIFNVRFSPDGSRLIVVARVTEAKKSLFQAYTMRVDGTEVHLIDKYATPPDLFYNWSPDGQQLVWMWKSKLMTGNMDGTSKTKILVNQGETKERLNEPKGDTRDKQRKIPVPLH